MSESQGSAVSSQETEDAPLEAGARGSIGTRVGVPQRLASLGLVAVLALTLLAVLITYHFGRTLSVNIGDLSDSALVSGFYADEPDIEYRYRWTKDELQVRFAGAGSARLDTVEIVAQGARTQDAASIPVTMSLSVNGQPMDPSVVTLTPELQSYTFRPQPGPALDGPFMVTLRNSTFSPPNDGRELGVKVDRVRLVQSNDGLNIPPLWLVLWSLTLVAGFYGLLIGFGRFIASLAGLLISLVLGALLAASSTLVAAYMPPLAAIVGVAGLLISQRRHVAHWPDWVDALGRGRLATWLMLGAMLLYAALALWTIPQVDWIGHADYAENAVIARNFIEGRGLSVDYVAQFYKDYPGISHPAETWPLLQPLMIAPFFALFGPETWAAKLPNLFIMLALAWAVFHVGSRLWEPRVGLLAGIFTLAHPYFFNSVLYPINDLGFTALFFVLAWMIWRQLLPRLPARGCRGERQANVSIAISLLRQMASHADWGAGRATRVEQAQRRGSPGWIGSMGGMDVVACLQAIRCARSLAGYRDSGRHICPCVAAPHSAQPPRLPNAILHYRELRRTHTALLAASRVGEYLQSVRGGRATAPQVDNGREVRLPEPVRRFRHEPAMGVAEGRVR